MSFDGFPRKTLTFLNDLAANNSRDWFEAHRDDYQDYYLTPALELIETLAPAALKLKPPHKAEARLMEASDPNIPALVDEGDRAVIALQAIHKLRKLSTQLDGLQAKAQGKAASLFARINEAITDVANLLEG